MMENFKVKVNNEAESCEVQQILKRAFGLKPVMFSGSTGWVAWDSECFSSYPTAVPTFADKCKEITIQELRDMVVLQQKHPNQKTIDAMREAEDIINKKHSHYKKDVSHLEFIDVYRVLDLFEVESHAVGHAVKKLLCSGQRGAKDKAQDIQEAIDSLSRELEMMTENESGKD